MKSTFAIVVTRILSKEYSKKLHGFQSLNIVDYVFGSYGTILSYESANYNLKNQKN